MKAYVLGDCQMTHQIVQAIRDAGKIQWVNRTGEPKSKPMRPLKTVEDVTAAPGPDQSWMDRPLPMAGFHRRVDDALADKEFTLDL